MTLTEQWKHGKLKEGWYYYKASDGRNDIATEYGLYCVEADNNVELEVLAPVPSYEEWRRTFHYAGKYEHEYTSCVMDYENLKQENRQLKELLKEWMHFYPIILYEHEDTLKTKDIVELFDKTREVLK